MARNSNYTISFSYITAMLIAKTHPYSYTDDSDEVEDEHEVVRPVELRLRDKIG